MFVVTLKRGQKMVIDSNIEVVVVAVRGKQVKVGVEAPKMVRVSRSLPRPEEVESDRHGQSLGD